MKNVLVKLASLKVAVVLLLLLLVGLATGTIIESSQGSEVAGRLVYYSPWFLVLEGAFALNVIASIVLLYPWGKTRVGFLTTHTALLVILAGASVTYVFKQEGQLEIREGQSAKLEAFPFSIKLLKFRVERYPGTQQPSNFRSDVEVVDPQGGTVPGAIWMNHELEYQGWRFYQSSYREANDGNTTILSVSKDPDSASSSSAMRSWCWACARCWRRASR